MTAPTEQEIREAAAAASIDDSQFDIGEVVHDLIAPIRYLASDEDTSGLVSRDCLWDDLRPSQAARLSELVEDIYRQADRICEEEVFPRIRELVVEAALTFAAEYPDAPRKPQLIPA